jgi:hypothetical protein
MVFLFQVNFGGRVGGVRPPYRDYQIFKNSFVIEFSLLSGGFDTPSAIASGYSTTSAWINKKPRQLTGAWYNKAHYPMNLVQVCAQVPVLQGM